MAPYKKPIYYTVYDWMVTDCNLKGGAERDLYALLYSLADNIGVAKVSLGYLAERTGYTDRGVKKAILNLIEAGWIMKARTSHYGVNEYGIVEPASIIGRFDKSKITEEQSSRDIQKTSEQSSPEQRNIVPLKTEKSSPDTPYIYNFYNKIYNNFFITDDPSEKKEKEVLLEEFFINFGLYQPMDEVMRFWEYHEQTGWKNGKGQKIVSKKSASHFWKIDETTARRQSDLARRILSNLISAMSSEQRKCIIAETISVTKEENKVIFQFESEKAMHILENDNKVYSAFCNIMRAICGKGISIGYRTKKTEQQ